MNKVPHCHLDYFFDYGSSTPVDPNVIDRINDVLSNHFINANAPYDQAQSTSHLIEEACFHLKSLIHAEDQSIIWTSGATESINLALSGCAHFYKRFKRHIITTTIEHSATKQTLKALAKEGFDIDYVPVDNNGIIDLEILKQTIRPDTLLVSVIGVHNELGVVQPLKEIGEMTHHHGIIFHVDAAQAIGKIAIDVKKMHIDLLSMSAHKCYGPKGVGALYRRTDPLVGLEPILYGGAQQASIRAGTIPTHQIVGMGQAVLQIQKSFETDLSSIQVLANKLQKGIMELPIETTIYGKDSYRVPHIMSFRCHGVDQQLLLDQLKPFMLSSHSSCVYQQDARLHAIYACTNDTQSVKESIRIGIGRYTTEEKVIQLLARLKDAISQILSKTP